MSYHKYVGIILVAGILAWLGWLVIVYKLSPYESMGVSLSFFFVTFFIALSCTFAVLGFYFRLWLFKNEIFYKHINVSLRQGILLGLIAVFALVFQMMKFLNWWSGMLILAIVILIEMYFSNRDSEIA